VASVYGLKPYFQKILRPLVRLIAARDVTANHVTLAALALSVLFGILFAIFGPSPFVLITLPIVLFIRMALNAIDGMLAREFDQESHLGFYLNELSDIASDAALYLPFAFIDGASAYLVVGIVLLSGLTETAGILSAASGGERRYDGPFGKSDRAFAFSALAVALAYFEFSGLILNGIFLIFCVLAGITIFRRVRKSLDDRLISAPHDPG
jgi:CDP-diacylglycerol--glycerol-3-phosphate 3-phosphatidyltransferase